MHQTNKIIYAIQHLAFEDLGTLEDIFYQKGYRVRYFDAGVDDLTQALQYEGLTVILGGPIGVNDDEDYPFLKQEIDLIKQRLQQDQPTLGICLGAQLMAKALDANTYTGHHKEIGWGTLKLSNTNTVLAPLSNVPVLHWHGDTFDLPAATAHLAASEYYPNQGFQIGKSLALQFHIEVDVEHIEQWLIGHHNELKQNQVDIKQLRQDSQNNSQALQSATKQVITQYMQQIQLI